MELLTLSSLSGKVLPEPSHRVTDNCPVWAGRTSSHGLVSWLFCHFPCFSTQNLTLHTNVQTDTQLLWYYSTSPTMEGVPPQQWCLVFFIVHKFDPQPSITKNHLIPSQPHHLESDRFYGHVRISTTFLTAELIHHKVTSCWWSFGFYGQNFFNLCKYYIEFYTNMEHIQHTMNILNVFNLYIYRIYTLYADHISCNYIYNIWNRWSPYIFNLYTDIE